MLASVFILARLWFSTAECLLCHTATTCAVGTKREGQLKALPAPGYFPTCWPVGFKKDTFEFSSCQQVRRLGYFLLHKSLHAY